MDYDSKKPEKAMHVREWDDVNIRKSRRKSHPFLLRHLLVVLRSPPNEFHCFFIHLLLQSSLHSHSSVLVQSHRHVHNARLPW